MDILKKLFEQHFRSPAETLRPIGDKLGASGRRIIRLSNQQHRAIGILYDVREENVAFLEFSRHFRRHGCRYRRFTPRIWITALISKKT